jgi:hypothetical protein
MELFIIIFTGRNVSIRAAVWCTGKAGRATGKTQTTLWWHTNHPLKPIGTYVYHLILRISKAAFVSWVAQSVWLRGGRPDGLSSIPGRGERIFPLTSESRPALRPTQPPVQWVPGDISPGLRRGRGVTLTTHPHLVPRSRMSRSYTSSPTSAFVACSGTAF